jgi:hypothetical protein
MGGGTSFAAPIVTAGVANSLGGLAEKGINPDPEAIRQLIRVTGQDIVCVPVGIFDQKGLVNEFLYQNEECHRIILTLLSL